MKPYFCSPRPSPLTAKPAASAELHDDARTQELGAGAALDRGRRQPPHVLPRQDPTALGRHHGRVGQVHEGTPILRQRVLRRAERKAAVRQRVRRRHRQAVGLPAQGRGGHVRGQVPGDRGGVQRGWRSILLGRFGQ